MASNIKLAMSPSQVRPFEVSNNCNKAVLETLGITFSDKVVTAMDSAGMVTSPSTMTPVQFLQYILPTPVRVVTAKRSIDELVGRNIVGKWSDEEIVTPIVEGSGNARPYGDDTTTPFSNFNINFEKRNVVRFEEGINVSVLEEERASELKINIASEKREAATKSLAIELNRIGFYGYNNGENRTYGFLNDPELPAYITVATGASSSTNWADKTFLEITNDIRTAFAQLRSKSGNLINPAVDATTLALPSDVVEYLTTVSEFGNSVMNWLKETYPNCRVVSAVELNGANGGANVMYLFADKLEGQNVISQNVASVFRMLGVEKTMKGYSESYSNATSGVIVNIPAGVVRYTGV